MARREKEEAAAIKVNLGDCVTEIGSPEVDRVLYDCQFRKLKSISTLFTRINVPKNGRGKGHKSSSHRSNRPKEEHISRMPDDILQFIISSLTIRERAATSILSTRWRYLWAAASFSSLNFDIPNKLGYNYTADMLQNKDEQFKKKEISKFAKWVDQVFGLLGTSRLYALRVSFALDNKFRSRIDRWIQSAAARGVIDVELDFFHPQINLNDPAYRYEFPAPHQLASSLKHLHMKCCNFPLSPDFTGFRSLATLSLSFIPVTQSILDCILSKCPILQFLSLVNCRHGERLRFDGPSSRLLKHLSVQAGMAMLEIELHDVTLLSFELGCIGGKLSIENAPHLAKLVLDTAMPIKVLSNLPNLETLFLSEPSEKSIMPQSFVFDGLKRLVFLAQSDTPNLHRVVSLLKACHFLQELEIDMGTPKEDTTKPLTDTTTRRLTTRCPHHHLKEIKIYGFHPLKERIELAKYLLKNAIVLERMEIYTASRRYKGNGEWSFYEQSAKPLKEVCNKLERVARSSPDLQLFSSKHSVTMVT